MRRIRKRMCMGMLRGKNEKVEKKTKMRRSKIEEEKERIMMR